MTTQSHFVDADGWRHLAASLAMERMVLVDLWGEPDTVRMALFDPESAQIRIVALLCPGGTYPSIGRPHPPAIRLERTVADLYRLVAEEAPDPIPESRPRGRNGSATSYPYTSSIAAAE